MALAFLAVGCGTTRMTDTQRTATEQLLVSNAIDQAVADLDFRTLAGKTVYFDAQYLDSAVDRGYLVSSVRQQLLASGCRLQDERAKADFVVEMRSGGIGTDRHAVLVGVPQMTVPTFVPGQPSQIPEIPLAKKTDQEGVAKVAVFAYNRVTGQPVWQSGVVQAMSTSKDMWVLGAGPFERGTIRKGTEFAGEMLLPHQGDPFPEAPPDDPSHTLTCEMTWLEPLTPKTDANRLARLLGTIPMSERPGSADADVTAFPITVSTATATAPASPPAPTAALPAKPATPAVAPNAGGQAETEPSKLLFSGLGEQNDPQLETEPSRVVSSNMGFTPDN